MNTKRFLYLIMLIVALIVTACRPKATPEPTATPTLAVSEGEVPMGFTEEGAPYRGNPDAPVTLVEHSEFQ